MSRSATRDGEVIIGREQERERLGRLLDGLTAKSASTAPARFVEITGDPGMGKTSMLADLGARARASGRLVLAGRAVEFGQEMPFGVVIDALDDHLASRPPELLTWLDADGTRAGLLAPVLPGLGPLNSPSAGVVSGERYRLYRAIRELLAALATPQGLVLLLDDLHWASEPTLELIAYLLALARGGPVEDIHAGGGGFPPQVKRAVLAEFTALSASARLILQAAAIAGIPSSPSWSPRSLRSRNMTCSVPLTR